MPIRDLIAADLAPCARLYVSVFAADPWNETWSHADASRRLAEIRATPGALGLVATPTEAPDADSIAFVIGFAEQWRAGERHFYIKEMCVHPDHQRQGLGSALLQQLVARLKPLGVNVFYLLTARGGPAEAFYAHNGFRTSARMCMMSRRDA